MCERSCSESVETGERLAEDESVDLVRAFVGVNALEIQHVPDHGVLEKNPVTAQDPAAGSRDLERLSHVVSFAERYLSRGDPVAVFHPREVQGQEVSFDDLL